MTHDWLNRSDDDPAIARIEASVQTGNHGVHASYEAGLFGRFWQWLFPRIERGATLAEAFGDAEVAQRDASARRTAEEAAEIAAKKEIAAAQAGIQRQVEVTQFIANVECIEKLNSSAGRALAFAKLIEQNPGIMGQVEVIEQLVTQLNLQRGLMITQITDNTELSTETRERRTE
jgi:hypothetical protein